MMKHTLLSLSLSALLWPSLLAAQEPLTLHVAEPGTLGEQIAADSKYEIEDLTLTGYLDGTDLALLRDLAGNDRTGTITQGRLRRLDLRGVRITGGGMYLDTDAINFQEGGGSATGSFHLEGVANTMPDWCFYGCNKLEEVVLPASVTSVGKGAFMDMPLTEVTLPDGIKVIGERAFYHSIYLKAFHMPASVHTIGPNAFAYCDELTEIDLPYGLRSIGKNAFRKCIGMQRINAYMAKPCAVTEKTFEAVEATLYVPKGTSAAYQAADGWGGFATVSETEEEPRPSTMTVSIGNSGRLALCSTVGLDFSMFGDELRAYTATGYAPSGDEGGTLQLSRVADAPAGTALLLWGTPGDYDVPMDTPPSGYRNLLKATGDGIGTAIPAGDETHANLFLDNGTNGEEPSFRAIGEAGYQAANGEAWLQIALPYTLRPDDITKATETITLSDTLQTYCSASSLDFTTVEGLAAYTATGYANDGHTVLLTRIYAVPAGTGIILRGRQGTYQVPTAAKTEASAYEPQLENMLAGALEPTTVVRSEGMGCNMLLILGDGTPRFRAIFNDSKTVEAGTAYLRLPVDGVPSCALCFVDDTATMPVVLPYTHPTAISSVRSATPDPSPWYNLQGQRVAVPQRGGIYIRSGKKYVMK